MSTATPADIRAGDFPRTMIENISVSRLVIGTNWFLGFSHCSKAKDALINSTMDRERIAAVLEVFLEAGVDALMGFRPEPKLIDAIKDAEQTTGRKCIRITTPHFNLAPTAEADTENNRMLAELASLGCSICMPHQCSTDALTDKITRTIRDGRKYMAMIRSHGMVPGISTHMPETPRYADAMNLDVATYLQIYNAAGFLMQIEADWVHNTIWNAKKPVIVIKPLAAGRLLPIVGLGFVWGTIRERDMVCVGTSSPGEAAETIEISRALIERRAPAVELQKTRSKQSM